MAKSAAQLDSEIARLVAPTEGTRVVVTKVGAQRHGVVAGSQGTIMRVSSPDARRGAPSAIARVLVSVHGAEFSTNWPTDALRLHNQSRSHSTKRSIAIGDRVELPARSEYRFEDPDTGFEGDTHGDVVKLKGNEAWVRMDSGRMDWFPIEKLRIG